MIKTNIISFFNKNLRYYLYYIITLSFLLNSTILYAESMIFGASQNYINIDTKFNGTNILLFGAKSVPGDLVIMIRGPKKDFIVNKKEKFYGLWYNRKRIIIEDIYHYYAIFSTNDNILTFNNDLLRDLEIKKEYIANNNNDIYINFNNELISLLSGKKLHSYYSENIDFLSESLFKLSAPFPKNTPSGIYSIEIYLIDRNNLVSFHTIPLKVKHIGFTSKIQDISENNKFLYVIISISIAIIAGFSANFIFSKLFNKY